MKIFRFLILSLIFINSVFIIFLLIDSLPDYLNDEKNNISGDEAGLTAMVINFVLPILGLIDLLLIVSYFYLKKK